MQRIAWRTACAGAAAALGIATTAMAQEAEQAAVEPALQEQIATDRDAAASQKRVDETSDSTRDLVLQYRQYLTETQSLREYTQQLEQQVKSQQTEIEFVQKQLVEIESTQRDVLPLMQRMLDTLARFVELDVPFQLEERTKRIAGLREMMTKADVTVSEKYRRIIEAYQIETEYGRTLEAYQGKLSDDKTVRFLRVGRVALLYQTLDGTETGYWDAASQKWVVDDSYAQAVQKGFAIADKAVAPDLIEAPIPAPTDAKS
jgi:chromosome segregation ATPase